MLSDAERHRLAEIESSLLAEDPMFVQRFGQRPRTRRWVVLAWTTFLAAVMITVTALVAGSALGVVGGGLMAACATVGVRASRQGRWPWRGRRS